MKRSTFLKTALLASAAPLAGKIAANNSPTVPWRDIIHPGRLHAGDKIGLIAPGSFISENELHDSIKNLEALGLQVMRGKCLTTKYGYFSGNDRERAADINYFFSDKEINGIICARGGYGTVRVLPHLDYDLIKNNPKVLCGYSDITALHQALFIRCGLVSFHGPMGISTFNDFSTARFKEILFSSSKSLALPLKAAKEDETTPCNVIRAGTTRGLLAGGNLSVLTSLIGTPFEMDYKDCILYIEETDEEPYRIDRMLMQLKMAKKFDGVAGIILGVCKNCIPNEKSSGIANSFSLAEIFHETFFSLGVPVLYGAAFGHIKNKLTLPFGVRAEMNTEKCELHLLESAVQ